jgi:predicted ATPase
MVKNMAQALDKLTIRGFKSIQELAAFELSNLNVLIGGNGAGKSNFVELFRMLRAMVDQTFGNYVITRGGADDFLFNGPQTTPSIEAEFEFGQNAYAFALEPTPNGNFLISYERQKYLPSGGWKSIGINQLESKLSDRKNETSISGISFGVGYYVYQSVSGWTVYHFHDTSNNAPMRRYEIVQDSTRLRADAANIAPFLLSLKTTDFIAYTSILDAIRLVIPFFNDFVLTPTYRGEKEVVNLSWTQKGSDYPMQPYHLSDGSIRFICLATALLQPNPPSTIIIDEPELGLHPFAIAILSELIQATANKTQVIISTQSPALVDYFSPENIIVVNREGGASTFDRLDTHDFAEWLDDYSLGELWQKNIVSGGPVHE